MTRESIKPDTRHAENVKVDFSLPIKGSVRVLCEIRNLEQHYGDTSFSADRSMLAHWAKLLIADFDDELKAKLPNIQERLDAMEKAKKVSPELLNKQVTI